MTSGHSYLQQTSISSDFQIPAVKAPRYYQTRLRFKIHPEGCLKALGKILKRLAKLDLPGKDQVEAYLRYLAFRNRSGKSWGQILNIDKEEGNR